MSIRRVIVAVALSSIAGFFFAPSASATSATTSQSVSGSGCTSVRQIGTKAVGWDKGMQAFTVRQYIGYCSDSRGKAWMNFASTYVWAQYHALGHGYRATVGIVPEGQDESWVVGASRQRLVWSKPVRTVNECTQGWSKLMLGTGESKGAFSSMVC